MKVVLVSSVFPPEHTFSSQTNAQTAEELVLRGHSVHVFAPFPSHPKGRLFDGYNRTLYSTSAAGAGYTLTHCFGTLSRNSTLISRFAGNLSFGITSGVRILFGSRPDVIFSSTWPIFASGILTIAARLRRVPLILRVQDVYPESLDSQRRVAKRNWAYRLLRQIDKMIAHSSQQVLVISKAFQNIYVNDRGVPMENVHVIPNWGGDEMVDADRTAALAFRRKLGISENSFVAVYAGNVGVASNAELLVEALAKLKDRPQIYLVIAGEGAKLGVCRDEVERQDLNHVVIHTPWKTEETGPVIKMADVLLLPTKGRQSLISIPSKLITYLLSGRPVIAAVLAESDTAAAVLESGAGWVVNPDSAELMAEAILVASEQSSERLGRMGSAGKDYALENHSRDSNLSKVVEIVEMTGKVAE